MPILELRDVSKKFGDFAAVNNFSLTVEQGELRCLLGPNGAGKSTCIDVITGRQKATGGQIFFKGNEITHLPEHKIARAGIGRKFQVPAVFPKLSVEQNFEVAFAKGCGPIKSFRNFTQSRAAHGRFNEIVELTGLSQRLNDQAGLLSHGETQWLEIGMVLMQDPDLLLLDEPTAGMTEQETRKTTEILTQLKGAHTLIVVEHDMAFVREISDIATVMHMGAFLAEGTIEQIEKDPQVRDVYLGEEENH